MIFENVRFTWQ